LLSDKLVAEGQHVMTVCNACRYCEAYCPVFVAMEQHLVFSPGELANLSNLCHDCGECLYACQFAPPHEFGIDVPRTMAALRIESYEEFCWPGVFSGAFRRYRTALPVVLTLVGTALLGALAVVFGGGATLRAPGADANFYGVVPHDAMVSVFGITGLFATVALVIGVLRFWRSTAAGRPAASGGSTAAAPGGEWRAVLRAFKEAGALSHLHGSGADCTTEEEVRVPWRRVFHHLTFYGFLLCFASTTVAALYHVVFGWPAPYGYTSLPVLLGAVGGLGLVIGPMGLLALRQTTDPARVYPDQRALNTSFIVLLLLTSVTGLVLLALRHTPWMSSLLVVHLGIVFALFVTLPYGKFVHGIYRTAALVRFALDEAAAGHAPAAK
jgi:citrate/tricarballylate utilization protein